MTAEAINTASARITAAIDAELEELRALDPRSYDATRDRLVAQVRELTRALVDLHQAEVAEVPHYLSATLDDPDAVLRGDWGDWSWELAHGAETVLLTIRGAFGSSVLTDQASPFEAVLLARSIEAQAYAVLESGT